MIVVTGGAGFIGSNLVATLERGGAQDIIVTDRLGSGDKWRNIAKRELADFIHPDDLFEFLDKNVNSIQMIFHLGAISTTTESDADLTIDNNFHLTVALWDWCSHHDVRLVYASSAATYGDGGEGFEDNDASEALAKLRPLNPYAWTKHLFDRRIARLIRRGGQKPPQWAGLKFFNVYGPNEYHKPGQASVAYTICQAIGEGKPARLFRSYRDDYPDGGQLRDFVWVEDCTNVMKWLWETPHVSGLFNVGSGKARSFNDVAKAVFSALHKEPRIEYVDMPHGLRAKYQYFTEAKMNKLRDAGYHAPFTELEDGVSRYINEFLATPDPYR